MDLNKRAEIMRQWVRDRGWDADDTERRARINAARRERYRTDPEHRQKRIDSALAYQRRQPKKEPSAAPSEWSRKYAERNNEQRRERYHTDPEYRRQRIDVAADYARRNRDRINARQRERYRTDPEFRAKRREGVYAWRRKKREMRDK